MSEYTKKQILAMAEEEDVEFIRLQFTDMSGTMKNMAITAGQLEKALELKNPICISIRIRIPSPSCHGVPSREKWHA